MALPAGRYGVTKNQLLKIKKLPMNTIKLIEELAEKFDLLGTAAFKNSTSTVTSSSDLVESGAVYDAIGWGNKNIGVWNNVALAGDATVGYRIITSGSSLIAPIKNNTNYTISRKSTSYGNRFRIVLFKNEPSSTASLDTLAVVNNDATLTEYTFNSGVYNYVVFTYDSATVISQDTAEAMIELGSVKTVYEPHHASVSDSLDDKADNSVIAPVENGSTASQAYAAGSHAIRNGAFITWKNAKAQDEPINDASDYTSGDVAELLKYATYANGVYGQFAVKRFGKMVFLQRFYGDSVTNQNGKTLGTLPSELRPDINIDNYTKCYNGSEYVDCQISIKTTGDVEIIALNGTVISNIQPKYVRNSIMFII